MALVDVKTAARELGLSPRTLYALTYRREIPFYKIGGKVLFDVAEIMAATRQEPRMNWNGEDTPVTFALNGRGTLPGGERRTGLCFPAKSSGKGSVGLLLRTAPGKAG